MQLYPWRRFRSPHSSCVSGSQAGVNYTSHHLRCNQVESSSKPSTCRRKSEEEDTSSRCWPGTISQKEEDIDSYSNVFTPQPSLRYTYNDEPIRASSSSSSSDSDLPPPRPRKTSSIRQPPQCRLPTSSRFGILIVYITFTLFLFSTTALATPILLSPPTHLALQNRQAIPDSSGNTGNEPAPVAPDVPPRPAAPTSLPPPPPTPTVSNTPQPTSPTGPATDLAGDTDPPNQTGSNPNPNTPSEQLTLTSPRLPISVPAIAGIAAGGFVLVCIILIVVIWAYRRRPSNNVDEIPIRRSRLGSRLGFRIFGDGSSRAPSRQSSRRGSKENSNEKHFEAWLDKGTISRPKNAWLENGLLSVPKPGFLSEKNSSDVNQEEKWVDRGTISAPRPGRPRSAEPLGRLSGMGMGMGYLK